MNTAKYVFIDRDGVINKDGAGWTDHSYIEKWEDFHFLPGVLDAFKKLADKGYETIIISNQQGVGKGYYSKEDLDYITYKMTLDVRAHGGNIGGAYYCVHLKEDNCDCRKPKIGLFLDAQKDLKIDDISGSFYIGDMQSDVEAGKRAGLKTITVIGKINLKKEINSWKNKPDYVCDTLSDAVELLP